MLVIIVILDLFGMYRAWRGSSKVKELFAVIFALSFSFLVISLVSGLTKTSESFSRLWFGLWFVGSVTSVGGYRIILRVALAQLRLRGINQKCIALVGDFDSVTKVERELQVNPGLGLRAGFYMVTNENSVLSSIKGDLTKLESINSIIQHVIEDELDEIWVALPITEAKTLSILMNELSVAPCSIRYVPDFLGFDLINHSITEVGRLPIVNLSVSRIGGWNAMLKWMEDKVLSSIILLLISPVMLLLAIGVKVTSPGPIFYRQERVSWNGKRFGMLKFRTMPVDVEKNGVQWGGAGSKTTTSFGAFIRRASLDELPQFINVLKGDMSIVGPRPERTEFVEQFKQEIPRYMQKHMVKGGITGWAQINGWRGDTDLKSRVDADLFYIEKWSLWLDFQIVFLTVFKVFGDRVAK